MLYKKIIKNPIGRNISNNNTLNTSFRNCSTAELFNNNNANHLSKNIEKKIFGINKKCRSTICSENTFLRNFSTDYKKKDNFQVPQRGPSKVAIVTGGASGIGEGVSKKLIENGYKVYIFDCNNKLGTNVSSDLGENCSFYNVDVTDENLVKTTVKKIFSENSRLDLVVNLAGVGHVTEIIDPKQPHGVASSEEFEKVWDINVVGTFNVLKYSALHMSTQDIIDEFDQRGCIINIGSVQNDGGLKNMIPYCGTKGAMRGMTMPISRELGEYGIRVVCLEPGAIESPLQAIHNPVLLDKWKKAASLNRMGKAEEIASTVQGIAECTYVTGVYVSDDGGLVVPNN